jgi:hypothetical protein
MLFYEAVFHGLPGRKGVHALSSRDTTGNDDGEAAGLLFAPTIPKILIPAH